MKRTFDAACWTADMIVAPVVGVAFVALSLWAATFDEFTFNDQPIRYAQSPGTFIAIVMSGVAVGLGCCGYTALRYWMTRTHSDSTA